MEWHPLAVLFLDSPLKMRRNLVKLVVAQCLELKKLLQVVVLLLGQQVSLVRLELEQDLHSEVQAK